MFLMLILGLKTHGQNSIPNFFFEYIQTFP